MHLTKARDRALELLKEVSKQEPELKQVVNFATATIVFYMMAEGHSEDVIKQSFYIYADQYAVGGSDGVS